MLHYSTFINQICRALPLTLRSLHSFSSFAPRPRCNWLSEGCLRRKGQARCLEANYEGLILSIAIRLQYIILSSWLTRRPIDFLKITFISTLFHQLPRLSSFFVTDYAYCRSHKNERSTDSM